MRKRFDLNYVAPAAPAVAALPLEAVEVMSAERAPDLSSAIQDTPVVIDLPHQAVSGVGAEAERIADMRAAESEPRADQPTRDGAVDLKGGWQAVVTPTTLQIARGGDGLGKVPYAELFLGPDSDGLMIIVLARAGYERGRPAEEAAAKPPETSSIERVGDDVDQDDDEGEIAEAGNV